MKTVGHGDCVHIGRAQIGVVTSATRSPVLKKTIALARLDVTHAGLGTEVEVGKLDGHQKRLPARIVRFPHYDPGRRGCVRNRDDTRSSARSCRRRLSGRAAAAGRESMRSLACVRRDCACAFSPTPRECRGGRCSRV